MEIGKAEPLRELIVWPYGDPFKRVEFIVIGDGLVGPAFSSLRLADSQSL
jgi:hypothetical protein